MNNGIFCGKVFWRLFMVTSIQFWMAKKMAKFGICGIYGLCTALLFSLFSCLHSRKCAK